MKRLIKFFMDGLTLLYFGSSIHAQTPTDPGLTPLRSIQVPVTINKMTSLIFPSAIRSGIRVSKDILVQRVKGVDNALELKALKRHFPPTNLAVYALEGRLYSFDLRYADDPPQLSFAVQEDHLAFNTPNGAAPIQLSGLPINSQRLIADSRRLEFQKPFISKSVRKDGMTLRLQGLYLTDGLLWMSMRVFNKTNLPYYVEFVRLYTEDRKRIRRRADQQTAINPIYQDLGHLIPGQSSQIFVLALPLLTIGPERSLICELVEKNGSRLLRLNLKNSILLKARN